MTLLINFKDAVNASVLNPAATEAVYYIDGRYQNEVAVRRQCPHATLHAITVTGETGTHIFACDSETGDLPIPKTVAWVAEQVKLDAYPIVVYANQDRWLNLGLLKELAHYGDRIERWDADYDGSAVVPAWASAHQYLSGNVDLDVARANFFAPRPAPKPKPATGTVRVELSHELGGGWEHHQLPGTHVHWGEKDQVDWVKVGICKGGPHAGEWQTIPLPGT